MFIDISTMLNASNSFVNWEPISGDNCAIDCMSRIARCYVNGHLGYQALPKITKMAAMALPLKIDLQ